MKCYIQIHREIFHSEHRISTIQRMQVFRIIKQQNSSLNFLINYLFFSFNMFCALFFWFCFSFSDTNLNFIVFSLFFFHSLLENNQKTMQFEPVFSVTVTMVTYFLSIITSKEFKRKKTTILQLKKEVKQDFAPQLLLLFFNDIFHLSTTC